MKTLDIPNMTVDLTPSLPYLHALETAENFVELFLYCQRHEQSYYVADILVSVPTPQEELLEEAMEEIDTHCPWLWPAIDRQILVIVEGNK